MRQIGKYQLQERIGVGGFGEVYKGFDPYIKRPVAIKTCTSNSEEIRSRFFQEAEIAGNLHHRNITTVYDFGVENDLPYLIQEYLEGEDLDAKIKRRDYLPLAEKLLYLIQIARGLAHAHAQGVMHRDVKPSNVRVLADGTTKIMDFGIAKLAQTSTGLTQTGMTLGTAAYLSPEQIRGERADVRTDIFSFGVTAYELLTFERPFDGDQISAVLYRLLHDVPRPIPELWPAAPPALVELVDRCVAKDPQRRYRDGGELLVALEAVQEATRELSGVYSTRTDEPPADASDDRTHTLPAHGTAANPALDDLDLAGRSGPPTTAQVPIAVAAKRPLLSRPLVIGITALVAVTAGAGWWLGRGDREVVPTNPPPRSATVPTSTADETTSGTADEAEPVALAAATTTPAAPPPERSKPTPQPAPPPASPPNVASRPSAATQAPPPEPTARPSAPPTTRSGAFAARPFPRKPHGEVWIDGRWFGTTPLRGITVDVGRHVLEIRPRDGTGDPLRRVIEVEADRETIITFDFEAGKIRETHKASSP
ncbi:MAG: protein kinase [Acidobacteriota bacterium]